MHNEEEYKSFIKVFDRYIDDEKLKEAFFVTEVEGFAGIYIGYLFTQEQISLTELKTIIYSGILDNDLPSLELLKYQVCLKEEKQFLETQQILERKK